MHLIFVCAGALKHNAILPPVADASTNKVWKEYKVTNAIKKVQFKEVN
jgi:hypothetical protein